MQGPDRAYRAELTLWFHPIAAAFAGPTNLTLATMAGCQLPKQDWLPRGGTYGDGGAPPWIVDASIGVPPLQRIGAFVAAVLLHGARLVAGV